MTQKQSYGYTGKILWVDLSTKLIREENPPEEVYRSYLGGYGLGVYYRDDPRILPANWV